MKIKFYSHLNKASDKKENKQGYTLNELLGTILVGYKGTNQLTLKKSPNKTEIYDGDKLLGSIDQRNNVFWDDTIYSVYKNKIKTPEGKAKFESANESQFTIEEALPLIEDLERESNRQRGITSEKVRQVFIKKYGDVTKTGQGGIVIDKDVFTEYVKTIFGRAFNKYGEQLAIWSLDGTLSEERLEERQRFITALGLLVQDHDDEYDKTFNGLTPIEIIQRFSSEVKDASRKDRLAAESIEEKESDYTIVKVETREESEKYFKYMAIDGSSTNTQWCITRGSFDSYVSKENPAKAEVFYFMLRKDYDTYKSIPKPEKNAPKDSFGLSMIAVSVKSDGSLHTATTRWNHANGGNDHSLTTSELSQLAGKSFFKAFPPVTTKEERNKRIINNIVILKSSPINKIGLYNSKIYVVLQDKKSLLEDDYGFTIQGVNWHKIFEKDKNKLLAIILDLSNNEYIALTGDTFELLVNITTSDNLESFKQIVNNAL
jgi:hypothetical protein